MGEALSVNRPLTRSNLAGRAASQLIQRIWQNSIGPRYNKEKNIVCRFHPSCSEYSRLAFEQRGVFVGLILMISRILRCNQSNTDTCVDYPPDASKHLDLRNLLEQLRATKTTPIGSAEIH